MIKYKIKTKKKENNILFNLLFKSKNLYGESLHETKKDILPYIYGIRQKYTIIDLKKVIIILKRTFKLIQYTLLKRKKILVIGNSNDINFLINKNFIKNNKNIIFFNEDWVHGSITNKKIEFFIKKKQIELIFVIKTSINSHYIYNELLSLNKPIISFLGTNQSINNIDYPIITNTKNIQSIYTLMYLFRKIF